MIKKRKLSGKEENFCLEIVSGVAQVNAYKKSYKPSTKVSDNRVAKMAEEILSRTEIKERIAELRAPAIKKAQICAEDILQMWLDIAQADPNDLVQHRRECCRHCWGVGHEYQWVNEKEFIDAQVAVLDDTLNKRTLENLGGYGFMQTKPPASDCPKCFGKGVTSVHIADTRNLTGKARALYAGMKQTANGGKEILLRDQDAALVNIAKFLQMFTLKPTDPADSPLLKPSEITKDPIEAARIYQQVMSGK